MNKIKRILFLSPFLFIIIATFLLWEPVINFIRVDICLDNGGKWASNGNFCIYKDCAEDKSCKPNYRNNTICKSLKSGIDQEELYFHLGMPESSKGSEYIFTGGGGGRRIKATIKRGKLIKIDCGI